MGSSCCIMSRSEITVSNVYCAQKVLTTNKCEDQKRESDVGENPDINDFCSNESKVKENEKFLFINNKISGKLCSSEQDDEAQTTYKTQIHVAKRNSKGLVTNEKFNPLTSHSSEEDKVNKHLISRIKNITLYKANFGGSANESPKPSIVCNLQSVADTVCKQNDNIIPQSCLQDSSFESNRQDTPLVNFATKRQTNEVINCIQRRLWILVYKYLSEKGIYEVGTCCRYFMNLAKTCLPSYKNSHELKLNLEKIKFHTEKFFCDKNADSPNNSRYSNIPNKRNSINREYPSSNPTDLYISPTRSNNTRNTIFQIPGNTLNFHSFNKDCSIGSQSQEGIVFESYSVHTSNKLLKEKQNFSFLEPNFRSTNKNVSSTSNYRFNSKKGVFAEIKEIPAENVD